MSYNLGTKLANTGGNMDGKFLAAEKARLEDRIKIEEKLLARAVTVGKEQAIMEILVERETAALKEEIDGAWKAMANMVRFAEWIPVYNKPKNEDNQMVLVVGKTECGVKALLQYDPVDDRFFDIKNNTWEITHYNLVAK